MFGTLSDMTPAIVSTFIWASILMSRNPLRFMTLKRIRYFLAAIYAIWLHENIILPIYHLLLHKLFMAIFIWSKKDWGLIASLPKKLLIRNIALFHHILVYSSELLLLSSIVHLNFKSFLSEALLIIWYEIVVREISMLLIVMVIIKNWWLVERATSTNMVLFFSQNVCKFYIHYY